MSEKRYYKKEYEEEYYIFDSNTLTEKEFEKKVEYDGYSVFADSLTPKEILDLLNENEKLKEEKYAYLGEITLYKGESTKRKKENEQLKQENEELRQENKKILDTINNKITEKGMNWYGAEDNSKEEKEANLQLCILEEVKEEIIKTMEE